MSDTITVRVGETLQVPIIIDDVSADTVNFKAWNDDGVIIDETENFVVVGTNAEATISLIVTDPAGTYNYLLTVTYSDGVVEKLPDLTDCEGDCETPELIICEAEPEA